MFFPMAAWENSNWMRDRMLSIWQPRPLCFVPVAEHAALRPSSSPTYQPCDTAFPSLMLIGMISVPLHITEVKALDKIECHESESESATVKVTRN